MMEPTRDLVPRTRDTDRSAVRVVEAPDAAGPRSCVRPGCGV